MLGSKEEREEKRQAILEEVCTLHVMPHPHSWPHELPYKNLSCCYLQIEYYTSDKSVTSYLIVA